VPSLRANVCAIGEVSVTVSLSGVGAPMLVQVHQDDGPVIAPGVVTFAPEVSGYSASFTFLARVQPFEANDHHYFQVEWLSPTGGLTTLLATTMNLVYQQGSDACSKRGRSALASATSTTRTLVVVRSGASSDFARACPWESLGNQMPRNSQTWPH
jgi:hypothetical protein